MRVLLVGPMGSGKSSVGRGLADALGLRFADSDGEVERRSGASIAWIFEREGEAGFRLRERAAILDLVAEPDLVLATGGGAVLDPVVRTALRAAGTVVFLATEPAVQNARTQGGGQRPLLDDDDDRAARLAALYVQRLPLYREVAHLEVPTDGRTVAEVVAALQSLLPPR